MAIRSELGSALGSAVVAAGIASVAFFVAHGAKAQTILTESRFTTGSEGWDVWTDIGNTVTPMWYIDTGNPGGCLYETDTDGGISYWRAPAKFLGNKLAAYRGTLSFDLRESSAGTLEGSDVILRGTTIELHFNATHNPESLRFSRSHVPLMEGAGWKIGSLSGVDATALQIQQVLGNLTGILIRAEYVNGPDNGWIDNVVLRQARTGLPSSNFDANAEDWWVVNDAAAPVWTSTGGAPGGTGGGTLRATHVGDGRTWRFLAPSKFVGDLSQAYGGRFLFDLHCSATDSTPDTATLVIESGSTRLEYFSELQPAPNTWTTFSIPLFPTTRWKLGGGMPTAATFGQALRAVTAIEIRGEYSSTFDTGRLDNVLFASGCPGDLNGDQMVDDADFSSFAQAYNVLDCADPTMPAGCPADLNGDGLVEDADFSIFVVAYNELLCP